MLSTILVSLIWVLRLLNLQGKINPLPPEADPCWCCYCMHCWILLWHDASWQYSIFSIPQCVTLSCARLPHGKAPTAWDGWDFWGWRTWLLSLERMKNQRVNIDLGGRQNYLSSGNKNIVVPNDSTSPPVCSCSELQVTSPSTRRIGKTGKHIFSHPEKQAKKWHLPGTINQWALSKWKVRRQIWMFGHVHST